MKYILSLDQGTTSSRAIVFNEFGDIVSSAQKEFNQYYPFTGWVEHDPNEIWASQNSVAIEALSVAGLNKYDIAALGITNQRETTIIWDRLTGQPIYNAIVWQDRRTAGLIDDLKNAGREEFFRKKTGLLLDPYFSATKIKWILDNVEGARKKAQRGDLIFGTVDTWLVWKFTNGKKHITDVSNASRTMLYNIHDLKWDEEILDLLDIPELILPRVVSSSEVHGYTEENSFIEGLPIAGIAGDQQAALFGQNCFTPGMAKNTYGTGCFLLMNTGSEPVESKSRLLTTIAWKIGDKVTYALEGSIFMAGAIVQWMRDELGIIKNSADIEELVKKVNDNGGVYFVPAFTGLGSPHWDPYARGMMIGLTRGVNMAHIARAGLESIAYQSYDVLTAMESDSGIKLKELRVDGGAAQNNFILQFQSDVLQVPVLRPKIVETTALGAALLAGLAIGFWPDEKAISARWQVGREYKPIMKTDSIKPLLSKWRNAIERSKGWETA
jgi:glycerol kinase